MLSVTKSQDGPSTAGTKDFKNKKLGEESFEEGLRDLCFEYFPFER